MTYEIWMEIYWTIFFIIRDWSWTIAAIFAVLAVLRPIKLYAFAQPVIIKDDFIYSSFIARTLWRAAIRIGWEKEDELDDDVRRPYGAHLYGSAIDVGITFILIPLLAFIWPIITIIIIGVYPIEAMHTHYKRKQAFVAKLKGEEIAA